MPILSQLRFFTFISIDPVNVLFNSLQTYATPNLNLPIVDVQNFLNYFDMQDDEWLSTFIVRFLNLDCRLCDRTSSLIAKATNVQSVVAECTPQYTFAQCLSLLARLPRLQMIRLFIDQFSIDDHGFMLDFKQFTRVNAPSLVNLIFLKLEILLIFFNKRRI